MDNTTGSADEKKRPASEALSLPGRETKKHFNSSNDKSPAATPSMEECVRYLEKNPTMRQIIGSLIHQEHSDEKMESSECFDEVKHYHRDKIIRDSRLDYDELQDKDDFEREFETNRTTCMDSKSEDLNQVPSSIPTLQEFAFKAVSTQFQLESKSNEQLHENLLGAFLSKTKSDVKQMYLHHWKEFVKEFSELKRVHVIDSLKTIAQQQLDQQIMQLHDTVTARRMKLIENAKKYRDSVKCEWLAARQEILDCHCSFVEEHIHDVRGLLNGAEDGGGGASQKVLLVCCAPDCRNLFDPNAIPEDKHCCEPDCTTSNCGCSMMKCRRCDRFVCPADTKDHAQTCLDRVSRTCGCAFDPDRDMRRVKQWYDGNPYCNKVMDSVERLEECDCCMTQCCPDCLYTCPLCSDTCCNECRERYPECHCPGPLFWGENDE